MLHMSRCILQLRKCHTRNSFLWSNFFSTSRAEELDEVNATISRVRNIGISAHIDSGKTTLTERILFYTGRIKTIHDVRGRDGVGAKMDSMELEREKGITIQSASTFCKWGDHHINIIDTPGHVDFTIEVERALRVLDGAILVLCGVSGVQSQSLTVDRQMKRYSIPRLAFINKLDRVGSNPKKVIDDLRSQLKLNAAAVQIPIGLEESHEGVVDLLKQVAYYFRGDNGEVVEQGNIPENLKKRCEEARQELIEKVADVDEELAELFIAEEQISNDLLQRAIRRQTIALKFVPVFMGSAYKNKGVQPLLDGVTNYLPCPMEKPNYALDYANAEAKVQLKCTPDEPTVALAFKLEEGQYGQLTYMRIYQGRISRGSYVHNLKTGKKIKIPRLVRMHSNEMEDVETAEAGDVVAMFGVDCASMDTFTDGTSQLAMTSMYVPEPVMSLAVKPDHGSKFQAAFAKALQRFTKEDPTLRIHLDDNSQEIIMSGMGELHLEVYVERLLREYGVPVKVGRPSVNYKETISKKASFNYLHKKQTGGSGQYARVIGYVEPIEAGTLDEKGEVLTYEFVNNMIGTNIPPEYIPSCAKGFEDATKKGGLIGAQMEGIRVVLTDGQSHSVDSSDLAFRNAAAYALRSVMKDAQPSILEPIMSVEVTAPAEYQGILVSGLNRRMGVIQSSEMNDDGSAIVVKADVSLVEMFGYSTDIRSCTQGKGEFTMEYKMHQPVTKDAQEQLIKEYQKSKGASNKK